MTSGAEGLWLISVRERYLWFQSHLGFLLAFPFVMIQKTHFVVRFMWFICRKKKVKEEAEKEATEGAGEGGYKPNKGEDRRHICNKFKVNEYLFRSIEKKNRDNVPKFCPVFRLVRKN